jgi:S1-C subfamily serine protease
MRAIPFTFPVFIATLLTGFALCAGAAASKSSPPPAAPREDEASYQTLLEATNAVVQVKVKAIGNARTSRTLGAERAGSGVLIAPSGLVLTIGYLVLEAEKVEVTSHEGKTLPATVVAYDHATGFGLVRPLGPLGSRPVRLGSSGKVEELDRVMIASGGADGAVTVATVVSKRPFAGYWEYAIDGAIFTSPPRADHSGAALINKDGELVGIGSLFVMDAMSPGERLPGNMFVPVDLLKPILDEMLQTGRSKVGVRPWIGVNSLEVDGHVKVLRVTEDSPADEAGLRPGDIILSVNGEKVTALPQLYRIMWAAGSPGVELRFKVLQGNNVRDLKIRSLDRLEFLRKKPTI